jgi:MFS transporter, OFA family, oxalate/formate antiporter
LAVGVLLVAVGPVVLLAAHGLVPMLLTMVIFAVGQSLVAYTGSTTLARFFGRKAHGAIRASISRIGVVGTGVGPLFTGVSERLFGSFSPALVLFFVLCLPVAVWSLWLSAPPPPPPPPPSDG